MQTGFDWNKTHIYGDPEIQQERLFAALGNLLWLMRYTLGKTRIYHESGRDIYYVVTFKDTFHTSKLDPEHLDEWEQDNIQQVQVDHILSRVDTLPEWWQEKWDQFRVLGDKE